MNYTEKNNVMSKKNRIRIFSNEPLFEGLSYTPTEAQTHYLKNVMRLKSGDEVFLFDGKNGEFQGSVSDIKKNTMQIQINTKISKYEKSPDVWLLFAPVKKEQTDIIVQKAVELGVSKIIPIQTEYTMKTHIKYERVQTQIIEAAEQSRRTDLPEFSEIIGFEKILQNWPSGRKLIYMDETGSGNSFFAMFKKLQEPAALLIGPEGGFSKKELEILKKLPYTQGISLGKRILRAETAAIAALSCWQAFCGDWR